MLRFGRVVVLLATLVAALAPVNAEEPAKASAKESAEAAVRKQGGDTSVLRATLPNGLRVVIVRNTLAPVVATSVNYLVGSEAAPADFPGTAHALEHMMFRGSPGLTADQLAAIGSVLGGDFNANTRESLTQYLYTVPAEDLDVALRIEAIRMQGLLATEAEWEKERGAIQQEVAQSMSSPQYLLFSKLRAQLFAGTPYQHDALGTKDSFAKTSAAMLKQFADTWYAPNNAILVIVGNVDPAVALATVKQRFGGIKAKKLPKRPDISFQKLQASNTTADTDRPVGTQVLAMRLPGLESPDFPALEVLVDVLSSRRFELYGLVPQGKAVSAQFALAPLPKASAGYAVVSFTGGSDPKAIDAEIRKILAGVVKNGVPPELVEAAKVQERRQTEFLKNSIEGLASVWADAVALYGLESPDEDLVRIEKVTVADVNRVARKYLDLENALTATLLPKGSGQPVASSSSFGGQEQIVLSEATDTKLPDWAQAALDRLVVPPSTLRPVVSKLENGLTLIVLATDVSNTVSVYGRIKHRPELQVPAGKDGLAEITDQLFQYGTRKLDRLQFQQALDSIGASARAGTNFSVQVLARDFERGVSLLAENELEPALPASAFEVVRGQYAKLLATRNASPDHFSRRSLLAGLFPKEDPSQRYATPESVSSLTLEDVRAYYSSVFRPDLTTIVVIGKIAPEQARATLEKYFGAWKATGPVPDTDLPPAPPNAASATAVPDSSRVQNIVTLAQTSALTRTSPDYYAVQLGNAVLGGSFYSTRLSIDLRKNAGLVYSVGSSLQSGKRRSVYSVQYACDPENVSRASRIVAQNIAEMQTKPVPEAELKRVKALLLRQIPLREASLDAIAAGILGRRDLDLPLDEPTIAARRYIELTSADVQAAFKQWLRPMDLVRITQGPTPK
jgi:zinc protease